MVGPAPIAQITDLQRDFLISKRASLMHVLLLHLLLLFLPRFLLSKKLLVLEVGLHLSIKVSFHSQFPGAFLK